MTLGPGVLAQCGGRGRLESVGLHRCGYGVCLHAPRNRESIRDTRERATPTERSSLAPTDTASARHVIVMLNFGSLNNAFSAAYYCKIPSPLSTVPFSIRAPLQAFDTEILKMLCDQMMDRSFNLFSLQNTNWEEARSCNVMPEYSKSEHSHRSSRHHWMPSP